MPKVEVVGTYLETIDPRALRAAPNPEPAARLECVEGCLAAFFRYFRPFKSETHQAELVDPAGG